jgi:hypothetical protein
MTEKTKLDYCGLSHFLLREAIKLTDDFVFDIKEEDGPVPFYSCGHEELISKHRRIGQFLRYAAKAYDSWEFDLQKDAESEPKKD